MKNRRHFLKQTAMAAAAIAIADPIKIFLGATHTLRGQENNSVTLLHTNDLHNQLLPIDHEHFVNAGGFRNTAELISSIKTDNKNVILLDAGDVFCGNIDHQQEHEATMRLMYRLGYDAVLTGNRDFEAGTDYLRAQWEKNQLPFVVSNYRFSDGQLQSLHKPYTIVQRGNIRTGVIGAGIDLKRFSFEHTHHQIRFADPVKEVNALATYLRENEKCQLVVCLSHLGFKAKGDIDDIKLAQQSEHIDVVIGGHTHTFMAAPHIVLNKRNQEVIINHAGYGGIALGYMSISFDDNGAKRSLTFGNKIIGTQNHNWANIHHLAQEVA